MSFKLEQFNYLRHSEVHTEWFLQCSAIGMVCNCFVLYSMQLRVTENCRNIITSENVKRKREREREKKDKGKQKDNNSKRK